MIYTDITDPALMNALDEFITDPMDHYYHLLMIEDMRLSEDACWEDIIEMY